MQRAATMDLLVIGLVAISLMILGKGDTGSIDRFLARRMVAVSLLTLGSLAALHLVYVYFGKLSYLGNSSIYFDRAFSWRYFLSFLFGNEHEHSILETALACGGLGLGIFGFQLARKAQLTNDPLNIREKLK